VDLSATTQPIRLDELAEGREIERLEALARSLAGESLFFM